MSQNVTDERVDLQGLTEEEMVAFVTGLGAPSYRARQIMRWIYIKGVTDTQVMTDLPKDFRERLASLATIGRPTLKHVQQSQDGTRKYLFELTGGITIESVLIRDGDRLTACISSQAGCGIGCSFCATALGGLLRNLKTAEIVGQLVAMQGLIDERITNVVMMGMGEPLANYRAVMNAIRLMVHPLGMGIGQRHITISTSGIVPGIRRLSKEGMQVGLAVSLHAPVDSVRDQLVPLNKKYPIGDLIDVCQEYVAATGRRVTMEYVMIDGVNDSAQMARTLGALLRPLLCHVNLIPLNPVPETGLFRPEQRTIEQFADVVSEFGVPVTVRKEMGADIDAACGQLRRRHQERATH